MIYFDHNATSPLCPAARDAWISAAERFPANPSSPHRLGARAEAALGDARQSIGRWMNCSPLDIVFTSGATEANNAVLHHASLDAEREVWVSAIEHPSVLGPSCKYLANRLRLIPVHQSGVIDLDWLADQLKAHKPSLVFIMAANNETGVLQPWSEASELCRRRDVPFGCDAAQWIGKLPAAGLGDCDFVTGCAHKFGGPTGIGFMKVSPDFRPLLLGGEQEDGRRAGTENLPGVLGMVAAWNLRERLIAEGESNPRELWREEFIQKLQSDLPEVEVLGADVPRLWNTVEALMPAMADCRRRWVVTLDKQGFAASTGSACASGKEKPSHVLSAMGYPPEKADRTVRFSAGWETTAEDWHSLHAGILRVAKTINQWKS